MWLWQVFMVLSVKFGKNGILCFNEKGKNAWFVFFLKQKKLKCQCYAGL